MLQNVLIYLMRISLDRLTRIFQRSVWSSRIKIYFEREKLYEIKPVLKEYFDPTKLEAAHEVS